MQRKTQRKTQREKQTVQNIQAKIISVNINKPHSVNDVTLKQPKILGIRMLDLKFLFARHNFEV